MFNVTQSDPVDAEVREAEADLLDAAGESEPLSDEAVQVGYERSLRDVSDLKAALTRLGAQLENSLKQVCTFFSVQYCILRICNSI